MNSHQAVHSPVPPTGANVSGFPRGLTIAELDECRRAGKLKQPLQLQPEDKSELGPRPKLRTRDSFVLIDKSMTPIFRPGDQISYELCDYDGPGLYVFYNVKADELMMRWVDMIGGQYAITAEDRGLSPITMSDDEMSLFLGGKVRHIARPE